MKAINFNMKPNFKSLIFNILNLNKSDYKL